MVGYEEFNWWMVRLEFVSFILIFFGMIILGIYIYVYI